MASSAGFKKNSSLLDQFQSLWRQCAPNHSQTHIGERAQLLALSSLLCLGRHSVTGLLSTCGAQFQDWTASYRLFSRLRFNAGALFAGLRAACLEQLPASAPVCLSVDDSLLPKRGAKTPGVAWRRDPQGPPFQTNLIRAQRVLQFSGLVPLPNSQAVRAIPVDFLHAPTPPKLPQDASEPQKKEHQQLADSLNLATRALQQWQQMKSTFAGRRTILLSDARFTTHRFLKGLPSEITLIGRVRKDAKLFYLPEQQPATGRHRCYGAPAPAPEQIRQDPAHPWQEIQVPPVPITAAASRSWIQCCGARRVRAFCAWW